MSGREKERKREREQGKGKKTKKPVNNLKRFQNSKKRFMELNRKERWPPNMATILSKKSKKKKSKKKKSKKKNQKKKIKRLKPTSSFKIPPRIIDDFSETIEAIALVKNWGSKMTNWESCLLCLSLK